MADKSLLAIYALLVILVISIIQVFNSVVNIRRHLLASSQLQISNIPTIPPLLPRNVNLSIPTTWEPHQSMTDPAVYKVPGKEIYISGAYLDMRHGMTYIRMPALVASGLDPSLMCVLVANNKEGDIGQSEVELSHIHPSWPPKSIYIAVLLSCKVTFKHTALIGEKVFLVEQYHFGGFIRNLISNLRHISSTKVDLEIPLNKPRRTYKMNMAICLKAASGALNADRFLEWLELYRDLGVSHLYLYDAGIEGDTLHQILQMYKTIQAISIVKFPFAARVAEFISWHRTLNKADDFSILQQSYLVSINDCFYRFQTNVENFLLIDLDELLLPYREESLVTLANRAFTKHNQYGNVLFQNSWYFTDMNTLDESRSVQKKSFFKLKSPLKRTVASEKQPKGILKSQAGLTITWHAISSVHPGVDLQPYIIVDPVDFAIVHHFREVCEEKFYRKTCTKMKENLVEDDYVLRFSSLVERKVKEVSALMKMS